MALPPRFNLSALPVVSSQAIMYSSVPIAQPQIYLGQATPFMFSAGPRQVPRRPAPVEKPPTTMAFIGNIPERCTNDLIRSMLQECGAVSSWRRVQGTNGRFQAFGFCDFEHPDATLRALRIIHGFPLGEKKLVVKVDEKEKEKIRGFIERRRAAAGKPPLQLDTPDALPNEPESSGEDDAKRQAIEAIVKADAPDLFNQEDGEVNERSPTLHGKGGNLDIDGLDREKKEYIHDEIRRFRQQHANDDENSKDGQSTGGQASAATAANNSSSKPEPVVVPGGPSGSNAIPTGGGGSPPKQQREQPRRAGLPPQRRVVPRNRQTASTLRDATPSPIARGSKRAPADRRSRSRSRASSRSTRRSSRRDVSGSSRSRSRSAYSRSSSAGHSRSSSASSSRRYNKRRRYDSAGSRHSRSRSRDSSVESELKREKREQERRLREKDRLYQERLEKWERRERKKLKEYERWLHERRAERKEMQREAKKLKEFLEDYDDERDDPKYYRKNAFIQRKRDFDREREADLRDRQQEKEELEEMRRAILQEGFSGNSEAEALRRIEAQETKLLRKLRAVSDSPPHRRLGEAADESSSDDDDAAAESDGQQPSTAAAAAGDDEQPTNDKAEPEPVSVDSPLPPQSTSSPAAAVADRLVVAAGAFNHVYHAPEYDQRSSTTNNNSGWHTVDAPAQPAAGVQAPTVALPQRNAQVRQALQGVFGDDIDDDNKDKPAAAVTADDKKQRVKVLIESIPTAKDALFEYNIDWTQVDELLVERRVKPWINKKINEYIGEDEPSLVQFIGERIVAHAKPNELLRDIAMVLDDEAEVFVVKMWRLLIYESEAKKLGLVKCD